ncbi:MAG: hypothetical protein KDA85_00090, partial [Planctomycetaceae bacterium]|nr:hypothetical protein [Planctomycetaceae bacterium]
SVTPMDFGVEVAPVVNGERLFVVTADGKLLMMESATFTVIGQVALGGISGTPPRVGGDLVMAEVAGHELKVFNAANGLSPGGTWLLNGAALAGDPIPTGNALLGLLTDGTILRFSVDGSTVESVGTLGQSVQSGPIRIGDQLLAVAIDGTLHLVQPSASK